MKKEGVISYSRAKIEEAFDAIIIGSGIGGLTCAALLAREGKKVLVLEKHYVAGGFTHVFKRKDYHWDVGLHYIGEVHRPNTFLRILFDDISDAQLKWAEMDDVYDKIFIGNEQFDYVKGTKEFSAKMKSYFPGEEKAIDEYIRIVYEAAGGAKGFFGEKALHPLLGKLASPFMRSKYLKYSDQTTLEVLQSLTKNKKLIAVLTGQYGDYGLPPAVSSFAIHAMVTKHYFNGGAYPIGGSGEIFDTILPVIEKAGGKVYVNAGVKEIIVKEGKATGVRMEDDAEISAPIIISNAGIALTYGKLVPENIPQAKKMKAQLQKVKPSASHLCLYIGIRQSPSELNLSNGNFWIYPNEDHDKCINDFMGNQEAPFPVTYISFPSAKDPDWEKNHPGITTVEIITVAPYEWFREWEDKRWRKRGEEYDALKEKFAQRMLAQLYKHVPQLEGKVDYYELSSPLSTKNFVQYENGEIYGIDHTPDRFRQDFLRAHTPIKNLFLTGQDVVTAGVGGAAFAGLITASAILGKNLANTVVKRVMEARNSVEV